MSNYTLHVYFAVASGGKPKMGPVPADMPFGKGIYYYISTPSRPTPAPLGSFESFEHLHTTAQRYAALTEMGAFNV
jgi:hypothetical protein